MSRNTTTQNGISVNGGNSHGSAFDEHPLIKNTTVREWVSQLRSDPNFTLADEQIGQTGYAWLKTIHDHDDREYAYQLMLKEHGADMESVLFNRYDRLKSKIFGCVDADKGQPEIIHLIDDFLVENSTTILYGKSGSHKTNILLDALYHLASDKAWMGKSVVQRNCLWIEYDTGEQPMRNRVASFDRKYGFKPTDRQLGIIAEQDVEAMIDLSDRWGVIQFGEFVQSMGYQILVMDALIDVAGEIDMNSEAMRHVMNNLKLLRQYVPTIILIAHPNKSHRELANSQNITNQIDFTWFVQREEVNGKQTNHITAKNEKHRIECQLPDVIAEFHFEKYANEDGTVSKQTRFMWFILLHSTEINFNQSQRLLPSSPYDMQKMVNLYKQGVTGKREMHRRLTGKDNLPRAFRKAFDDMEKYLSPLSPMDSMDSKVDSDHGSPPLKGGESVSP